MRRVLLWLIAFSIVLVLALEFVPIYEVNWVGFKDVTVHLRSSETRPANMAYSLVHDKEDGEFLLQLPSKRIDWDKEFPTPVEGEPFQVSIMTAGRDSLFERRLSKSSKDKYLLLELRYADGSRSRKLVELPDLWTVSEMTVDLP